MSKTQPLTADTLVDQITKDPHLLDRLKVALASRPEPTAKPVPVPANGWVVVEGKYPMYLKDGRAYHCERDAQTGEAPVHSMVTVEKGIMEGRIKALFQPDDEADQSTPALKVTPEMLDVAAREYFYATALYAPEEGREDDWPTRIPHRVRETIRDGLVAALDALEEHRMVETDYVPGRTVTPEQLDQIARHLYAVLRDRTWSAESLMNRETPEWEEIAISPWNDDVEWRIAVRDALKRVGFYGKREEG